MGTAKDNKTYYAKNKEQILAHQHEYIQCECCMMVKRCCMSNHKKSKRHHTIIEKQKELVAFKNKWGTFIELLIEHEKICSP